MPVSFSSLFFIALVLLTTVASQPSHTTAEVLISSCLSLRHHLGEPSGNATLILTQSLVCDGAEWRYPVTVLGSKTLKGLSANKRLSILDLSNIGRVDGRIIIAPEGHLVLDGLVLHDAPTFDDNTFHLTFVQVMPHAAMTIRRSFILYETCPKNGVSLALDGMAEGDYHVCGARILCGEQIISDAEFVVDEEMNDACSNDHVDGRNENHAIDGRTVAMTLLFMALGFVTLGVIMVYTYRLRYKIRTHLDSYLDEEDKSTTTSEHTVLDFSLPTRRVTFDDFSVDLDEQLGSGGFGTVYGGRYRNKKVAVKVLLLKDLPVGSDLMTEASISLELHHPNVIQSHAAKHAKVKDLFGELHVQGEDDCVLLFMEYCDKGELSRAIDRGEYVLSFESLRPKMCAILHCALDIAKGLEHLHSLGIVHCDMKPDNIIRATDNLDPRGYVCKVCDFGLSKRVETVMTKTDTLGMISYMPPEMLRKGRIGRFTDIYSFGMLLWELVTSDVPYSEVDYNQILQEAVRGRRPIIPDSTPSSIKNLIKGCWTSDYLRRPNATDVIRRLTAALSEWYSSFPARSLTVSTPQHIRNTWRAHAHQHARSIGYSESLYSDTAIEDFDVEQQAPSSMTKSFSHQATAGSQGSVDFSILFAIDLENRKPADSRESAGFKKLSKPQLPTSRTQRTRSHQQQLAPLRIE